MRTLWKWLHEEGMFGWNYWHLLKNPWKVPQEAYYRMKWFVQRGRRGYSDVDQWNLYAYVAGWLPEAIKGLRANKLGHPVDLTAEKWATILKEMEAGLRAAKAVAEMSYKTLDECMILQKRADKGLKLFVKHFFSLWS